MLLPRCSCQGGLEAAAGGRLELAVADITRPDSLKADLFQGVHAVISCTAVTVAPKEGDTANRDKYKQVCSSVTNTGITGCSGLHTALQYKQQLIKAFLQTSRNVCTGYI